jgi:hypothetical protein
MYDDPPNLSDGKVAIWALVPSRAIAQSHSGVATSVPDHMGGEFIFVYYMQPNSPRLQIFVNELLEYLKDSGWYDRNAGYWFEGQLPQSNQRRWNILDNVLGWDDDG